MSESRPKQGRARQERRGEVRLPVRFPVTLGAGSSDERLRGTVRDLSRNGIGARIQAALPAGFGIGTELTVAVAVADEVINTTGSVCWTRPADGETDLGLRLGHPLGLKLPLPDVIEACSRLQPSPAASLHPAEALSIQAFQEVFPYTFAGLLFWNFSDSIHSKHTFASGVCSLATFRLARMLEQFAGRPVTPALDPQVLQKTIDDLDHVVKMIKDLSAAYRRVKDRFGPVADGSAPEMFDAHRLVVQTVEDFARIAAQLNDEAHLPIDCENGEPDWLVGRPRSLALGLESLLLQVYAAARFNGGSRLRVRCQTLDRRIAFHFLQDASAFLSIPQLRLQFPTGPFPADLSFRDRRAALWLFMALALIRDWPAEITVRSESGANEVVLWVSRES